MAPAPDIGKIFPEMNEFNIPPNRMAVHPRHGWTAVAALFSGLWLIASPFTFGSSPALTASDAGTGFFIVVFSWLSLSPHRIWPRWALALCGVWLQMAPLFFWAPNPATYVNDTLVGVWVIALAVLIPGIPGQPLWERAGPDIPRGWSYNPSTFLQRIPVILLGLAGWLISRYLAAHQLGYIPQAWDPVFSDGTMKVLNSNLSKSWPVSDAGLGALSYTFEVLLGFLGSENRWRTAPWLVIFFGILVVPLGLTHILLVISQPLVVGFWCFLCLAAAVAMLFMIPQTVDEVVAVGQYLLSEKGKGRSLKEVFWKGGGAEEGGKDERTPAPFPVTRKTLAATSWGITFPWPLWAMSLTGFWLALSPLLFNTPPALASANQIIGALIFTVAVVASAEVVRPFRFFNLPLALAAAAAPFLIPGAGVPIFSSNIVCAVLIAAALPPVGEIRETYGGWDRLIR